MNWLFARPLRPAVLLAGGASFVLNLMLLVPALFTLQVFERVFTSRSVETLVMLAALVAIALALVYAMDVLRARSLEAAAATLDRALSPSALVRMLERKAGPAREAAAARDPDPLRDVATLRGFLGGSALVALFDAPWLPVHLLVITVMHPWLGAAAAAGAVLLLGVGVATEKLVRPGGEAVQVHARAASRQAQSLLRRAEVIVGMGMTRSAAAHWLRKQDALLDEQGKLAARSSRLAAVARLLQHAFQAGLLAFGAWLVIADHASPGIMIAATLLLGRALTPLAQLIGGWKQLVQARAAWQRLAEPDSAPQRRHTLELPAPAGRIDVESVVFGGGRDRLPLLRGVSLQLPAGSSLGLIGASGSGKSTLARLLLGLWRPQAGVVRLDGADIARWDRERLAPHVGYLPQDVELFPGTVAENIARLARLDGDDGVDAAQVTAAAQRARAHEMILRLPQGYDTPVGEGGSALSGGQRQRIALARALFGEPRLVVLDEPNANLDSEGEAALAEALRELKSRGTTVVVVTHRSQVLSALDKVAVLKDGVLEAFAAVAPAQAAAATARLRAVGAPAQATA